MFSRSEEDLVDDLGELASCNPFSETRRRLERRILDRAGQSVSAGAAPWKV